MINVEMSDLPVEKINKIRAWLDKEECGWLENCVAAEIARLQVEATNHSLEMPHRAIMEKEVLPMEASNQMREAAFLQHFLAVLTKMREKETRFQTARLTI